MASNISFTYSLFWGQIWGLPFDMMTEKIGKEIGSNLGIFMAVDTKIMDVRASKIRENKGESSTGKTLKKVWKSS